MGNPFAQAGTIIAQVGNPFGKKVNRFAQVDPSWKNLTLFEVITKSVLQDLRIILNQSYK